MITGEQRRQRQSFIGSSDVAAIWNLIYGGDRQCLYRDARDVYFDKVGVEREKKETDAMSEGTLMEVGYLAVAEHHLGKKLAHAQMFVHPHAPMCANTDGLIAITDANGEVTGYEVVEIKRVCDRRMLASYGRAGTDDVPNSVYLQVQHQCACVEAATGKPCKLAHVLADRIGKYEDTPCGLGIGLYKVKRDEEIVRSIVRACTKFMKDYVLARRAPEINYEKAA